MNLNYVKNQASYIRKLTEQPIDGNSSLYKHIRSNCFMLDTILKGDRNGHVTNLEEHIHQFGILAGELGLEETHNPRNVSKELISAELLQKLHGCMTSLCQTLERV